MFPRGDSPQQQPMPQADGAGLGAPQGDGMRHYTLDEDEGGGFHSTYTGPDGQPQHGDHTTFDEAQASMNSCFGGGDDSEAAPDQDLGSDDDSGGSNIAADYGRKASK